MCIWRKFLIGDTLYLHVKAGISVEYKLCELSNTLQQESNPHRNCEKKSINKKQSMDDMKAECIIACKDSKDDYRVQSKYFLSATTVRGYTEILTGKITKIPKHT